MDRLYIARGERGLFKLGRTQDWPTRVHRLRTQFRQRGDEVAETHLFQEFDNGALGAENTLIRVLTQANQTRVDGREWFRDVDFRWAMAAATLALEACHSSSLLLRHTLTFTAPAPPAARSAGARRKVGRPRLATA
jgi:hypothetical protein